MIVPLLKKYRKRPPRAKAKSPTAGPPVALVLAAATYDPLTSATLVFDRAIDISGIDVTQFFLVDGINGFRYQGSVTAFLVDDRTVFVPLVGLEEIVADGVHLTVSAASGIVAVDDGGTWEGCTNLALPFP